MTSWVEPNIGSGNSPVTTLWNTDLSPWFCVEYIHFFLMVKCCVVHFCSNSNKTGYIMHKFPKDANLRRQCVKFVQVERAYFEKPSVHFFICSSHFPADCHEKSYVAEMGLKQQKQLLPGAVPTIQSLREINSSEGKKRPIADSEEPQMSDRTGEKTRSRALKKLEVNRVSTKLIYLLKALTICLLFHCFILHFCFVVDI